MEKNSCNDLYRLIKVINEQKQKGAFDLKEIKKLLNSDMFLRVISKNEVIHPGEIDVDYACYIICGSFFKYRIEKNGKLNILNKAKALSWLCLDKILDPQHSNFVESKALEECIVLYINRDYFIRSLEENGKFALEILKDMLTVISTMSMKTDHLIFSDAKEHLLFYILHYWDHNNQGEKQCKIRINNENIAAELGVNVRTVYRIKNTLKEQRLITLEKGKLIVDQDQIEQIKKIIYS